MMKPEESIQIFVPLKVRKQNGRPKIMPPSTYLPSEDRTQDPHILRAIGRAWGWRRRMEAGEFNTVTDLAKAVGLAERHVSRQLRLAYFAPDGLPRLIEVKTTNGWERTPFHITRNELAVAEERRSEWRLFRLWNFSREPKAFELHPPLDAHVSLTATTFQASFH